MSEHVAVVGAGLAGLAAACELAEQGAKVTVLESRRQVGGATFSFRRGELPVDNGQHVLLRCYERYLGLLERLGTAQGVNFQRRFEVPVLTADHRSAVLRRNDWPAPLHLVAGLARYRALTIADRLRAVRAAAALRRLDCGDAALDERTFGAWLTEHGQNSRTVAALWNLITVAALNCDAQDASLALAAKVFRTALLQQTDAADIGVPAVPLANLHCQPAEEYLWNRSVEVRTSSPVRAVEVDQGGFTVTLDHDSVRADAVVLAVPPVAATKLCPRSAAPKREDWARLGAAPILNLHVVLPRPITDRPFTAVIGSPVQWVFDRTAAAGLGDGQYLALSVSAAQQWIAEPTDRLGEVFLPELRRLFPAAEGQSVTDFFVTRESRATFRQVAGTQRLRPDADTAVAGLSLAGAWTATGWPDTMEGAVRSGQRAAEVITRHLSGVPT